MEYDLKVALTIVTVAFSAIIAFGVIAIGA